MNEQAKDMIQQEIKAFAEVQFEAELDMLEERLQAQEPAEVLTRCCARVVAWYNAVECMK